LSGMRGLSVPIFRALVLAVLAGTVSAACSSSTTSTNFCTLCTTAAIVKGTVRDTAGAPAPGAAVGLSVFVRSCGDTAVGVGLTGAAATDAFGQYRYIARTTHPAFTACIDARAKLLADTAFAADTAVTGHPLQFRNDYPVGAPLDSLTVDMVLRRR
jgi:hypothetical protein